MKGRLMAQNNDIYFNKGICIEAGDSIPEFILDFWGICFNDPSLGFIRTLDDSVVAIYFYIKTNIQDNSIIKFQYIKEEMVFDSIYVYKNLYGESEEGKEYRYDSENKFIASYDFYMDQPFCAQNKEKQNSKSYSRYSEPQKANEALKKISKSYLTKEITTEVVSCFYPTGNINEIYWLIR